MGVMRDTQHDRAAFLSGSSGMASRHGVTDKAARDVKFIVKRFSKGRKAPAHHMVDRLFENVSVAEPRSAGGLT